MAPFSIPAKEANYTYSDVIILMTDGLNTMTRHSTNQADIDLWTSIQMGITGQQWANDPGGRRFVDHIEPAVDMFLAYVKRRKRKAQP